MWGYGHLAGVNVEEGCDAALEVATQTVEQLARFLAPPDRKLVEVREELTLQRSNPPLENGVLCNTL